MIEPRYKSDRVELYHADCLSVLPQLSGVDFIFSDPPYGHNNNNGDLIHRREEALGRGPAGEPRAIENDGAEANDLIRAVLPLWAGLLSPGCCCCCCCGGGGPDPQFARWSLWIDEVLDFKQMVVWDKGPMGMGWHYRRSYETVLVSQKPGAACRWYDETSKVENIIRPNGFVSKVIPSADQHPTEKSWHLASHFIGLHAQAGHTVLDSFMGHGSTGVAALKRGCSFVGIELDEEHYQIAERRIRAEEAQAKFAFVEEAACPS